MLATDMDGTVIPLEVDARRKGEIATFRGAVEASSELTLAYVTGRDLALALKGIGEHELPAPHVMVCDVGTSVYQATPSGFQLDQEYAALMEEARGGLDVREVRHEMAHLPGLLIQADEKQTESKLSYHLSSDVPHQEILASVQEVLDQLDGRFQAVYSVGAPHGRGLLDLLPDGVAKDFAIHYLHDRSALAADDLVYAGDSGNDLAAMLTGFKVIVVGNATPGLKAEVAARGAELGILERIFFATELYVAGVMEGCRHYGFF
jgi:alpha-amylase